MDERIDIVPEEDFGQQLVVRLPLLPGLEVLLQPLEEGLSFPSSM